MRTFNRDALETVDKPEKLRFQNGKSGVVTPENAKAFLEGADARPAHLDLLFKTAFSSPDAFAATLQLLEKHSSR